MNYPVSLPIQLRAILRALRQNRGLTQAQAGRLLGVNQKRLATIEKAPGVTSFDQISRLVTALGGRLVVEVPRTPKQSPEAIATKAKNKGRKITAQKLAQALDSW